MALRLGLLGVAGVLGWLTACSGQSGTEKDGGDGDDDVCGTVPGLDDPTVPAGGLGFAVGPIATAMGGDFVGAIDVGSLSLMVHTAAPTLGCSEAGYRYEVPLRVDLSGAGVDEAFATVALVDEPNQAVARFTIAQERASSTWRDPAMEAATDVSYVHTLCFDDPGWTVEVGWQAGDGAGGTLGTWPLVSLEP